jgi:hypothetical protein
MGRRSTPNFVDLDGDDDLDLAVGTDDGTLFSLEDLTLRQAIIISFDEDTINAAPQLLGADVAFLNGPTSSFDGSNLTVRGAPAEDTVSALSIGAGADQIGVAGAVVSFGGVTIAALVGGDADADGDALSVVAVNGGAEASGALLTLGPDGSDDHDPNGAFDVLAEGENGANSFTYTVSGGALQSSARGADTALFAIAQVDPSVAITAVPALRAIGEVAQLTAGTSRQTLTLANDDIDPAVFALVPSLIEANAPATRFHNVSGPGAEIMLQEPKRANDPATGLQIPNITDHAAATFTLLVLEKGMHTLEDGMIIQVGEISTNKFSSMILRMSPSPTISPPRRRSFVRFRPMPGSISPSRADAPRMQTASS